MVQAQQALLETYLSDSTKLYEDWYKSINQPEEDSETVPYGFLPSKGEIKERFDNWFNEKEAFLRQKICQEWDYPSKRAKYQTKQLLIIGLVTDGLATAFLIPTQTLSTATILVLDGYLERLCPEEK